MQSLDFHHAASTLRAVRKLKPDPIPEATLRRVLKAATWAPSGGNRQPWRVIAVRDPAIKQRFAELYRPRWSAYTEPYRANFDSLPASFQGAVTAGDYLAEHLHETPVVAVFCFDPGGLAITDAGLDRPSVVGGGSLYPAVQNLLLACRTEGLGCVLTTLLCAEEPEVRKLLEIPEPWATYAHVPIGWPVGRGHGPINRRPVESVAYADQFGKPLFPPESGLG
ncbi:MAG: nitroreductase family protein [Gammaproteobacteria bacterium]|nr:nitroreductase family protein [Gammaproteobacteria bacterium]